VEYHGVEPLTNSDDELRLFQRANRSLQGACNLCGAYTSNLKKHVSRHLRQIALFAIPRADYRAGDEFDGSAQAMQSNESRLSSNTSSAGTDTQQKKAADATIATEAAMDTFAKPQPSEPLAVGLSFWEDVTTYGVVDARAGRADLPPRGLQRGEQEWDSYRDIIIHKYRNAPLGKVAAEMAEEYGFKATYVDELLGFYVHHIS
jgi:hypothetical protein